MLFNSLDFVIWFLPAVLLVHWVLLGRTKESQNAVLLIASFVFYSLWDYRFSILLAFSILLNFYLGSRLYQCAEHLRKYVMRIALLINLGVLGFFKYANFFLENINNAFLSDGNQFSPLEIIIPVGISFYTFHGISYIMDIYYRRISPQNDLVEYALFVAYFPLLVAGPIERATNLLPQLSKRRYFATNLIKPAASLIIWGFFKKVVVADSLGVYVDDVFSNYLQLSSKHLVSAGFLFSLQIYMDFSGYTDIARGVSKCFGLDLLLNFRFPYFSRSIPEFWSRWHISLSSFLNDYVFKYVALELRGLSKWGVYIGILVTFLVSGVWHGAGWNYVVWGLLHAMFYVPEFLGSRTGVKSLVKNVAGGGNRELVLFDFFRMLRVFSLVTFTLIFFRSKDLASSIQYLRLIGESMITFRLAEVLKSREHLLIILKGVLGLLVVMVIEYRCFRRDRGVEFIIDTKLKFVLLLLGIAMLGTFENTTKFIYFQF